MSDSLLSVTPENSHIVFHGENIYIYFCFSRSRLVIGCNLLCYTGLLPCFQPLQVFHLNFCRPSLPCSVVQNSAWSRWRRNRGPKGPRPLTFKSRPTHFGPAPLSASEQNAQFRDRKKYKISHHTRLSSLPCFQPACKT